MIIYLRNSISIQMVWGLLALLLFNFSVDVPDASPIYHSEDLSINDQESIVEIIVEKVLGYEEAFSESEDQDSEEQNKKNNVKVDIVVAQTYSKRTHQLKGSINLKAIDYHSYFLAQGHTEILAPPPKS